LYHDTQKRHSFAWTSNALLRYYPLFDYIFYLLSLSNHSIIFKVRNAIVYFQVSGSVLIKKLSFISKPVTGRINTIRFFLEIPPPPNFASLKESRTLAA